MAYTRKEEAAEFWMLTKGILQDSTVDTEEAAVVKHWLDEHAQGEEFRSVQDRLAKFMTDGYIDRFESKTLIESIGTILRTLRTASA